MSAFIHTTLSLINAFKNNDLAGTKFQKDKSYDLSFLIICPVRTSSQSLCSSIQFPGITAYFKILFSRDFSKVQHVNYTTLSPVISLAMEEALPLLLENSSNSQRERRCYLLARYVLAALSCSGFCVVYLLRVNLSVALVAMVNSTYANEQASANNPECQSNSSTDSEEKVRKKKSSALYLRGKNNTSKFLVYM